jgi:TonB family protein
MRPGTSILMIFLAAVGLAGQATTDTIVREAIAPKYPRLAWIAHVTGSVVLSVEIGSRGQVEKVEATSGHPLLAGASIEAARHWLFRPGSVSRKVALTFSFKIYPSEAERGEVVAIFKTPFDVEVREITPPPMID